MADVTGKELAVVSNAIIEARFTQFQADQFQMNELKIFMTAVSMIDKNDEEFSLCKISAKSLQNILNITNKSQIYETVKESVDRMTLKSAITIEDKAKKKWTTYFLFSMLDYYDGILSVEFNKYMRPFLLQLKKNFTKFRLSEFRTFRSKYSIRLYQLLKQYENLKERIFELKDLRLKLGVTDDKLKKFIEFRRRVLNTAQKELSSTPLAFQYYPIKEGRKFTKIKFVLKGKENIKREDIKTNIKLHCLPTASSPEPSVGKLINLIPPEYLTGAIKKMIIKSAKENGAEYVKRNIQYTINANPKNFVAYLSIALKENYGEKSESKLIFEEKAKEEKEKNIAEENKKKEKYEKYKKQYEELSDEKIESLIYKVAVHSQLIRKQIKNGITAELRENSIVKARIISEMIKNGANGGGSEKNKKAFDDQAIRNQRRLDEALGKI